MFSNVVCQENNKIEYTDFPVFFSLRLLSRLINWIVKYFLGFMQKISTWLTHVLAREDSLFWSDGIQRIIASAVKRDMYFAKDIEKAKEWLTKETWEKIDACYADIQTLKVTIEIGLLHVLKIPE